MGKNKDIFKVIAMVLVMASFSLISCAPKEVPPEEKVTLVGYNSIGLTGPYAASQVLSQAGAEDCIEYLNRQNKIPGVEFKLRTKDNGTDVAQAVSAFKLAISQTPRPVCFSDWSTGTSLALKDVAKAEKIPAIASSFGTPLYVPPGWLFGVYPTGAMLASAYIDWFMEQWKEERPPKLAFVTWDIPCGRSWITDEVIAYAKFKGMEYVGDEFIPLSPVDTTPILLRLKEKGIDVCSGFIYTPVFTVVLKDADRIGFYPQWMEQAVDQPKLIEAVGPLANGVAVLCPVYPRASWEEKYPQMVEMIKEKGRGEEYYGDHYAHGWVVWTVATEAVRIAVEKVGAENVTGQDVYNAFLTIKDFDPGVGLSVTYSETRRAGAVYGFMNVVKNEQLEFGGKYYFRDINPGGKDVPIEYMPK